MITSMINSGKEQLLNTFRAVPDDKLGWKPLDNGRGALDLFIDAAQTAAFAGKIVETRGEFKPDMAKFAAMRAQTANWTREEALGALETNHAALLAVLEACPPEELGKPVTMPFGGGITLPLAGWALMSYRSYVSRFAQINYIQTLYGDFESHN